MVPIWIERWETSWAPVLIMSVIPEERRRAMMDCSGVSSSNGRVGGRMNCVGVGGSWRGQVWVSVVVMNWVAVVVTVVMLDWMADSQWGSMAKD